MACQARPRINFPFVTVHISFVFTLFFPLCYPFWRNWAKEEEGLQLLRQGTVGLRTGMSD